MRKQQPAVTICAFPECARPIHHCGLCVGHVQQKRRHGSDGLWPLDLSRIKPSKVCSFEGCGRHGVTKGFCAGHYRQHWKGKPLTPIKVFPKEVDGRRECDICGVIQPVTEYESFRLSCKPCRSTSRRATRYGVSFAVMAALVNKGTCDVCNATISPSDSMIDHCHTTGRVRGVLCTTCNLAVGYLNDDPEQAAALAAYLRRDQPCLAL